MHSNPNRIRIKSRGNARRGRRHVDAAAAETVDRGQGNGRDRARGDAGGGRERGETVGRLGRGIDADGCVTGTNRTNDSNDAFDRFDRARRDVRSRSMTFSLSRALVDRRARTLEMCD